MTLFHGWATMVDYVGNVNVADAIFVVVIMAMASSLPIIRFTETVISKVSAVGKGTPASWWLAILTLGPLLGSLITGPAAMTICALLLRHRFYSLKPSERLKYATLGLLFVNISVGGVLTQFGSPPVVIASQLAEPSRSIGPRVAIRRSRDFAAVSFFRSLGADADCRSSIYVAPVSRLILLSQKSRPSRLGFCKLPVASNPIVFYGSSSIRHCLLL
jgi:Putative Na+/H+ antiporter